MTQNNVAGRLCQKTPATRSTPRFSTLYPTSPLPDNGGIVLTISPAIAEIVRSLSLARSLTHEGNRRAGEDFGKEGNRAADSFGLKAEVGVILALEQAGLSPVGYQFLATQGITGDDFRLGKTGYNVKCSLPGKAYFAVNERQRQGYERNRTMILPVIFQTENSAIVYHPLTAEEVQRWPLRPGEPGRQPYRSYRIDSLRPLHSWNELLSPATTLHLPEVKDLVSRNFLTALLGRYADDRLRLEIRPAWPTWMQSTLYPNGFPDDKTAAFWQFQTGKRAWFPLCEEGIEAAALHALRCAGRYEVYFGVLPRIGESGKGADVPTASCLWADIDGGDEGVEGAQRLILKAGSKGLPAPTFEVISGGGIHAYWLLSQKVSLSNDDERRRFKDLLKRLCLLLGGESPNAHADTSRADVASILRVPGTFNRKREQEPRSVQLVHFEPEAEACSYAWWGANLPAIPLPPRARRPINPVRIEGRNALLKWARDPYPEGKRHKDLTGAAAWLVRDLELDKSVALDLLRMKADCSPGLREITDEELEAIIRWA